MAEFGPPTALTEDDLLEVLRRNFEGHWIEGLLDDPSSRSLFVGLAAQILRVQAAVDENLFEGAFILTAPGRAKATSTLRLTRPSGAEVTLTTAVRFQDDRGAVWRAQGDTIIPASGGPQTVDVPIETDRAGYFLNSFEPLTYQALDPLPDPNFTILLGPDPAAGGTTPFLDQHGKERRAFRSSGESDAVYRHRLLFLQDQVSPRALAQTVVEVLDAFTATKPIADLIVTDGLRALVEPFRDGSQRSERGLAGSPAAFFDDAFLDDTSGHEIRSIEDACAWFDVYLPTPADPGEARLFYDDGFFDDPEFGYPDLPPGEAITTPLAALADELDRRRATCVRFRFLVGEDVSLIRDPRFGTLDQAGDWEDQAGATAEDEFQAALQSFDGDATYAVSDDGTGAADPLDPGDLVFDLPAPTAPLSVERVVLFARVRRADVGAGADPSLRFVLRPTTAGAAERVGPTFAVTDAWQPVELILEENPLTTAPWTLADISGVFGVGLANTGAAGATEELRVSELTVEIVANYG